MVLDESHLSAKFTARDIVDSNITLMGYRAIKALRKSIIRTSVTSIIIEADDEIHFFHKTIIKPVEVEQIKATIIHPMQHYVDCGDNRFKDACAFHTNAGAPSHRL